jgi:iron complex outermembrane receptor protein
LSAGVDARYIGRQWLRGDEANETSPLSPYTVVNARTSLALDGWNVSLVVANVFDTRRPVFGTFNENRTTSDLERFLTPASARGLTLELRRFLGSTRR